MPISEIDYILHHARHRQSFRDYLLPLGASSLVDRWVIYSVYKRKPSKTLYKKIWNEYRPDDDHRAPLYRKFVRYSKQQEKAEGMSWAKRKVTWLFRRANSSLLDGNIDQLESDLTEYLEGYHETDAGAIALDGYNMCPKRQDKKLMAAFDSIMSTGSLSQDDA